VRPLQSAPGLALGGAVWTNPSQGYIPYHWDTTLLSRDVDQKITLEVMAPGNMRASTELQFRARIDGKIAFKQMPEIVDPSRGGDVQIQMQNVSKTPVKIQGIR